jgi:XRE family transcriptional regulator, fatty acid utilization regulator
MNKQTPQPKVPLSQVIGRRIRQLRSNRNWSQRTLSARIGIAQSRLSRYELGQNEPPLRMLLRFAQTFEVPLDLLLRDTAEVSGVMDDRVLERLRQVDGLDEHDRGAVLALLDVLLGFQHYLEKRRRMGLPEEAAGRADPRLADRLRQMEQLGSDEQETALTVLDLLLGVMRFLRERGEPSARRPPSPPG